MNLEHAFHVPAGADEVWVALRDSRTIGECLPAADLAEADEMGIRGSVTVDHVAYKGAIRLEDADDAAHTLTFRGLGQEQGGETLARASAKVTLVPEGGETRVDVDLEVTAEGGEVATIGGSPEEIAQEILDSFADELRSKVADVEQEEQAVEAALPVEAAAPEEDEERPADPPPLERMSPMDEVALVQAAQETTDEDIARAQETAGDEPDGPVDEPEAVAEVPEPVAEEPEPEPVAVEPEPEPEPVAVEPEPVAEEPEPEPVVEVPEPEPEPVAEEPVPEPETEPEPVPEEPPAAAAAAPSARSGSIPPPGWEPEAPLASATTPDPEVQVKEDKPKGPGLGDKLRGLLKRKR